MDQKDQCKVKRWDLLKQQLNNLCPEEFRHMLREKPDAVLLDVRTPEEFAQGALPGAQNMDFLGVQY
jgi:predicted sulfurtransferase